LLVGVPQAEQKRPLAGTLIPQEEQVDINSQNSLPCPDQNKFGKRLELISSEVY
jgi:hypothetical protein